MNERIAKEKSWKRLFDQWIFGLFGTFVVLMLPISLLTDDFTWGVLYIACTLIPLNILYVKRYRMRLRFQPELKGLYRRQLVRDGINSAAFFLALNHQLLFASNVAYMGVTVFIGGAMLLTLNVNKQTKQQDMEYIHFDKEAI
jgi:NADH:ubiquinone oxidoreductase subunit 6 (subunit J)